MARNYLDSIIGRNSYTGRRAYDTAEASTELYIQNMKRPTPNDSNISTNVKTSKRKTRSKHTKPLKGNQDVTKKYKEVKSPSITSNLVTPSTDVTVKKKGLTDFVKNRFNTLRALNNKSNSVVSNSNNVTSNIKSNISNSSNSNEPTNSKYINYYTKGDEGVLPDLVVTPKGADFLRDSRGNYARTVEDLEIAKGGRNFNVYYDKTLNKNLQQETPRQKPKREKGLGDDFENLIGALISGNYTNVARSSADNFRKGNYIRGSIQAAYPLNFVGGPVGALANAATSGEYLTSDEGVKKTYNLIKQGEYGRAAVSATGDVLALLAGGRGAYVAGKPVVNYLDRQPLVGDVLEHTPIGRSKSSLSKNRAYRETTQSEVDDLGRTGVFREEPGVTPVDDIAELPKGAYTDPKASYGHGSKYFTRGNLPEIKGHRVHSKEGVNGPRRVISVPGRGTKWHVGHGGHTLVREVKNGKVIYKKNDIVNKPEYSWDEIPMGKAIHKRFNLEYTTPNGTEKVVEGIGRTGAKAYKYTDTGRMTRVPIGNKVPKVKNPVGVGGRVKSSNLLQFYRTIEKAYPTARKFMSIKNKGYNKLGQRVRTNLVEHTNGVIRSAQTAPLPKGVTRKQFVEAALVHDLGKLFNPTRTHGRTSSWLAQQMGIRLNKAQRAAIEKHMDFLENSSANTQLENALHTVDVARGLPYSTIVNRYRYLNYK